EPDERAGAHGLARAGLAHDRDALAGGELEGQVVHHAAQLAVLGEADAQAGHAQSRGGLGLRPGEGRVEDRRRHQESPLSSRAWMSLPMAVAASARVTITRPGITTSQGACVTYARPASRRAPHSEEGGATPSPRKLRPEAHTIDWPMHSVNTATS